MYTWLLSRDDVIKQKLRLLISMWYDSWYMGGVHDKEYHLSKFDSYYDPSRFDGKTDEDLHNEEVKFLQELQEIVDKSRDSL